MRTHITYTTQARAHALLHALVHPCTHTHKSTCAYTYTHAHRQTRKQATTHATAQVHPCIHKQQLPPLPKSTRAYKGNSSRHCPNPTPYMATHGLMPLPTWTPPTFGFPTPPLHVWSPKAFPPPPSRHVPILLLPSIPYSIVRGACMACAIDNPPVHTCIHMHIHKHERNPHLMPLPNSTCAYTSNNSSHAQIHVCIDGQQLTPLPTSTHA